MNEKNTNELKNVLGSTHLSDFNKYVKENRESMITESNEFSIYIKNILHEKKIKQQTVFLHADIPEHYGYKLLSGEKHTKQRDVILRICYAARMSLDETQRALEKYAMPQLYPKIPRDAFLMIVFNERPGSIIDVNELLKEQGLDPLRTSGVQD